MSLTPMTTPFTPPFVLIKEYMTQEKYVAAICAAPALVLTAAGILEGRKVTCYPAPEFIEMLGDAYLSAKAHVDGKLITAAGPGCFTDFARAILDCIQPGVSADVFKAALIDA